MGAGEPKEKVHQLVYGDYLWGSIVFFLHGCCDLVRQCQLWYNHYMENLEFNSRGQWTLIKSNSNPGANDFKSYRRSSQGALPADLGTKGQLHNTSNTRPPKQISDERMAGKVPVPVRSADDDRNPGSPGPAGDRR